MDDFIKAFKYPSMQSKLYRPLREFILLIPCLSLVIFKQKYIF